jgi:hypothetical protein
MGEKKNGKKINSMMKMKFAITIHIYTLNTNSLKFKNIILLNEF